MSTLDPQDPMDRLRAANPIADGGPTPPPIDPLRRRRAAAPDPDLSSRTSRPRSGRVVRLGVVAGAVAAAAVAVGAVALTGAGGPRTDVVAEARAALAPRGEIVHTVVRSALTHGAVLSDNGRRVGRMTGRSESWTVTDPLRTRSSTEILRSDGTRENIDSDYADGVERSANSWGSTVKVFTLSRRQRADRDAELSTPHATQLGPDPVQGLHDLLDAGTLRADGERVVRGRRLLRLVGHQEPQTVSKHGIAVGFDVEYLVDPQTYAPVRLTVAPVFPPDRGAASTRRSRSNRALVNQIDFERYERIPLTDKTATLLELDTANRRIVDLHPPRVHKPR